MQNPKFIYIETYGCSANQNNTELMKAKLQEAGLEFTCSPEVAEIILINSCVVKGPTETSIKRRVQDLERLEKPIIVAGCMPQVRETWLKKQKNVYLLGIFHINEITKLIRRIIENKYEPGEFLSVKKEIKLNSNKIRQNKLIGITQISEGCLGDCSFCFVKKVKGNLFSYPKEEIIQNIKQDIKSGCKEIWLTSQDLASYGLENRDSSAFIELLSEIIAIEGKFKLRLGMMNPNHVLGVLDKLIEIYKNEKVYKFIHLPVQSGSNKILKDMGRKYTREEFLEIVKKIKKEIPEAIFATDVIVAYPGETDSDFHETISLLSEVRPDVVNFTKYWAMKGTRAAEIEQVDVKIAKKRVSMVQKLHLAISLENNKKYLDKEAMVFVNEQEGMNCLARDENYRLYVIRSEKKILGKKLKIKGKRAFSHYILGELI
jgi:threonylcarbamoyladenosine tRNA methylthiotransferase CDKAL1